MRKEERSHSIEPLIWKVERTKDWVANRYWCITTFQFDAPPTRIDRIAFNHCPSILVLRNVLRVRQPCEAEVSFNHFFIGRPAPRPILAVQAWPWRRQTPRLSSDQWSGKRRSQQVPPPSFQNSSPTILFHRELNISISIYERASGHFYNRGYM